MATKFQYNKTTIQDLQKQLAIRIKALPILKNKETALRKEIKKRQSLWADKARLEEQLIAKVRSQESLWREMPKLISVKEKKIVEEKVIGVKVPVVKDIEFAIADVNWEAYPAWFPGGIKLLQDILEVRIIKETVSQQIEILEEARRKTTQKVNLYEKVQIPEMEDAILKIKRFLEDKENIAKAAQKIVKKRQKAETA